MGRLHDDVHILLMHPTLETRFEVTVNHALTVVLENLGARETAEQGLTYFGRIGTIFLGKGHGFCHGQHADPSQDLISRLGYLTNPVSPM